MTCTPDTGTSCCCTPDTGLDIQLTHTTIQPPHSDAESQAPSPVIPGTQRGCQAHTGPTVERSDAESHAPTWVHSDEESQVPTHGTQSNSSPVVMSREHSFPADCTHSDLLTDWDTYDICTGLIDTDAKETSRVGGVPIPCQNSPSSNIVSNHNELTYLQIYDIVRSSKVPNFMGCRIQLPHALNIPRWRHYLSAYNDQQLCDFLAYGWPMNYTRPYGPCPAWDNHASAREHPEHVNQYLATEIQCGAMLGPFNNSPFHPPCQISPLMTREKRGDPNKRRIILDLSWPPGMSVNCGIPKDVYLNQPFKLSLPSVDDAVSMIRHHGKGCHLYSVDLERAYRQLRSDPLDWPLLGIQWNGETYIDVAIPFGIRWGAMACQRTTNAICYIHSLDNNDSLCYIDDFLGASPPDKATQAFVRLQEILKELGVSEASHKATPPTTRLIWVGIEFDTIDMAMRVPQFRITETLALTQEWISRDAASRHQLQKLLGKLFYISQCVKPARLFVSRMLITLRSAPRHGVIVLDNEFKKDVHWFNVFLPDYNGVHLIDSPLDTTMVELDSCLTGCGGICGTQYYHATFPQFIIDQQHPICHLEMLNIVVAAKLWGSQWTRKRVTVFCDNAAAVSVLITGRGRDPFLLQCAREIWLLSALHDFTLAPQHKPGSEMVIADALSRVHLRPAFQEVVSQLSHSVKRHVSPDYFKLRANL